MKIENTYDYLKYRAVTLSNERSELQSKLENNQIYIDEINKKIKEIKSTVNEGFEMFSPKAAEEKSFNKQEVKELQMRLIIIADENNELKKELKKIEEELRIVSDLISSCDDKDCEENQATDICSVKTNGDNNKSSKENGATSKQIDKNYPEDNLEEIADKLSFCKDIVESDPRRVKIEIAKILNESEKD